MYKKHKGKKVKENILYIGDNKNFLENIDEKNLYDCVYIDPPYNTKNKFRYNDKMKRNEWLNFLETRINLSKKKSIYKRTIKKH